MAIKRFLTKRMKLSTAEARIVRYQRRIAKAEAAYEREMERLREGMEKIRAPAQKAYQDATKDARAAYIKAVKPAEKKFTDRANKAAMLLQTRKRMAERKHKK